MTEFQELRVIRAEVETQRVEWAHRGMRRRKSAPWKLFELAVGRRFVGTALVVQIPACCTVEPRANAWRLDQIIAVALGNERAKLGEVVVRPAGRAGSNRQVLTQSFRVVAERAAMQNVDDRLRLALRKCDRRSRLRKRRATFPWWPQLIQKKGDSSRSSHGCLSQSGEL